MVNCPEPDFGNLPAATARLFDAAARTSFFQQSGWYDLIARHARPEGVEFHLYLDGDPANAGLPLRTDGARRLRAMANAYTLEYGPIGAPGADVERLASAIAAEDPRHEMIVLEALDPLAASFPALVDGFRHARWAAKPVFDFGVWYEETGGLDFRRYFETRPAILRNTVRRKTAAAQGIEYRFAEPATDIEALIADYETVYRNSWKEPEPFSEFMPALIRFAFRVGALRMGIARIAGRPAAAQFWLLWAGRAVIYKLAHDKMFDELSPGTLLTMKMMERVLENDRPDEINFGRGDDPYKKMWLGRRRERWIIRAANPRTLHGATRAALWLASRMRDKLTAKGP